MVDVIIIGSGIGGLYLASLLKGAKLSFLILEANPQIGGLIDQEVYKDKIIPKGPRIFLHSRASKLLKLARGYKVPFTLIRGALPRYIGGPLGLEKVGFAQLFKYPTLLPRLALAKRTLKEESIGSFFKRVIGSDFRDQFIEPLCAGIWATDPEDLSMDHLMGSIKRKAFLKGLLKKKGLVVFPEGLKNLLNAMAQEYAPFVYTDHKVHRIQDRSVTTNKGTFQAQKIVLATSYKEACTILKNSSIILDPVLDNVTCSSLDVVSFCFDKKQKRPFGSGVLIPKTEGLLTRGVLFDADFLSFTTGDVMSCFIQNASDPIFQAYGELKKLFPHVEIYDKAFLSAYPEKIFQCHVGVHDKLQELQNRLKAQGIYMTGAYPKVGVADVLDKTVQVFNTLYSSFTDLTCNKT